MTNDWRNERKEVNRAARFGIGWVIIIVVIVGLLGVAAWAVTVAVSGPKGQGDAIITKNSSENWTAAQATFEDLYAEAVAADLKVTVNKTALDLNPSDRTLQTNYTGVQSVCLDIVARYNAESRKYLAAKFKAADLPAELGTITDTDCKE